MSESILVLMNILAFYVFEWVIFFNFSQCLITDVMDMKN